MESDSSDGADNYSFRYHEMNRIGLPFIIAWLWLGFGKEIYSDAEYDDKMGNGGE